MFGPHLFPFPRWQQVSYLRIILRDFFMKCPLRCRVPGRSLMELVRQILTRIISGKTENDDIRTFRRSWVRTKENPICYGRQRTKRMLVTIGIASNSSSLCIYQLYILLQCVKESKLTDKDSKCLNTHTHTIQALFSVQSIQTTFALVFLSSTP
jgi:hypothetical protein